MSIFRLTEKDVQLKSKIKRLPNSSISEISFTFFILSFLGKSKLSSGKNLISQSQTRYTQTANQLTQAGLSIL